MELRAGNQLLHYRLVDKIGEGGMGVVWRAVDTTLDREVAIKLLPDVFGGDPERAARFEREAKLLASLNHPGVATIHSVHAVDGTRFLAMELVPGHDLSVRLMQGAMPLDEALEIGRQLAEALEFAHENGVVHRDLKPQNVMITGEGRLKVLDFGLAKALDLSAGSGAADLSKSPTMTTPGTQAGVILGTAAYMSPEQARGRPVDRRADIWALGCVLYEMLTGRQAFAGETVTDILASIVTRDPDWSALPASTPRRIRNLLERCLDKDPARRLRDAGEARIVLGDVIENPAEPETHAAQTAGRSPGFMRFLPWAMVLVAGVLLLQQSRRPALPPQPSTHLSVSPPFGQIVDAGLENGSIAVSRDGRVLAYCSARAGQVRLYVRRLDSGESKELAGTEGAHNPFLSPDGQWVAFTADSKLRKIPVSGGAVFDLCDAVGDRGGVWLPNGDIVYVPEWSSPLMRVPEGGGAPVAITVVDTANGERTHRWPDVLPGGRWVVFTVGMVNAPAAYEGATIEAVNLETGERHIVHEGASIARYVAPGYLVVSRQGVLFAAPIDVNTAKLTGPVRPVLDGVDGEATSGVVNMAFAENGTMVYVPRESSEDNAELVLLDSSGNAVSMGAPPREYIAPRISPDGRYVATLVGPSLGRGDVWRFDIARQTLTRLTFSGDVVTAAWMPDSENLVVVGEDQRPYMQIVSAFGTGEPRRFYEASRPIGLTEVTPDAQNVLFTYWGRLDQDIEMVSVAGGTVQTVLSRPGAQFQHKLSPDGRWIAYASTESGAPEVYVEPFGQKGGRWQVSNGGGIAPRWSPDGGRLYYLNTGDSSLWSVLLDVRNDALLAGRPVRVFTFPTGRRMEFDVPPYDIMPDGKHFIALQSTNPGRARRQVDVILNFAERVKQSGQTASSR